MISPTSQTRLSLLQALAEPPVSSSLNLGISALGDRQLTLLSFVTLRSLCALCRLPVNATNNLPDPLIIVYVKIY